MTITLEQRNRHPADELADVRAEIKWLQAREAELRDRLLRDGASLAGDEYQAVVIRYGRRKFDIQAAEARLGAETLAPFFRKSEFPTVRLKQLVKHRASAGGETLDYRRNPASQAKWVTDGL